MNSRLLHATATAIILTFAFNARSASTLYWIGGNGSWDTTGLDWTLDPDRLPPYLAWDNVAFDTAVFSGPAGTISLNTPISVNSLTFATDGYSITDGTLTLGGTATLHGTSGTQTISSVLAGAATSLTKTGAGTIILAGANTYAGATILNGGTLDVTGSIGVASVSASTMSVGSTGDATLRIENGGSVKNISAALGGTSGTKGTVVIDGAGSLWNITNTSGTTLSIASGGNGSVTVSDGGSITTVRPASFTTTAGHTGDLLVDGAGSTFTSTNLNVQGAGTGTVTISTGGTINSANATLGNSSGTGGTVTALVTGAGSKWNINTSGTSSVTMYGGTSLSIIDGGIVNVGWSVYLGDTVGTPATITVGGNSATLNVPNAGFVVGDFGSGTLVINDGGIVNAGYNFRIGNDTAAVGIVNQYGGTMTVTRYIEFFKGTAEYHLLGGTLIVGDAYGAGIVTPTATSYLFELGGGTLRVLGDDQSSLTNYAKMTLKSGTTSTLDTPSGGFQTIYLQGVVSGSGNLRTTGGGTVALNAVNTYTGSTTIEGGVVRYGVANALSTSTNIIFNGGALEFGATPFAITAGTGGRQVQWLGDGGFSSYNGNRTIDYEGGAALTWGAGNFVPDGHIFLLGASPLASTSSTTTFGNAIDFNGGERTVQVSNGPGAIDAVLSGVLSNGTLVKTGAGTLSLTNSGNTYSGGTIINGGGISFVSGALSSGPLTINGGELQWASGNTEDITAGGRVITFGPGGTTFNIAGGSDTVTFGGNIDGTGSFTKSGSGALVLSGNNTYSGATTTLSAGTLTLASVNALPTTGTLVLSGGTLTSTANRIIGNPVTLGGNATLGGSTNFTLNGTLTNSGGNRTLTVNAPLVTLGDVYLSETTTARTLTITGSGNTTISGIIANRSGSGTNASSLTKSGTGTLTVSGSNTFTGTTTVSGGTLRATTNASALGGGTLTVSSTGVLELANDTGLAFNRNTTVSATTANFTSDVLTSGSAGVTHTLGTLSIGAQNLVLNKGAHVGSGIAGLTFGNVSLSATGTTFTANAGTRLTLGAVAPSSGNRNFTVNGAGDTAITGAITTGTGTLTKSGGGKLTLSGANTYTGITTISGGTLQFAKQTSLYNNTSSNWTAAKLVVESGATAAFNVGGTSEFTAANIDTLKALGTSTGGFKNGAILGLDTSNASGGNFTYSSAVANPNGGSNTLGLAKLGSGTLTLEGANTYTGTTAVHGGLLRVNGSLAAGSAVSVNNGGTLGGSGTVAGTVAINSGGFISPGNSPGILNTGSETWNGGGSYIWELNSATGIAGTNWDLLNITGTLVLGSLTSANPFVIAVTSLDAGNSAGSAQSFNPAQSYSWIIATASGGISGFGADKFSIDTLGFLNAPGSNYFSLTSDGSNLMLNYSAVPEPAAYGTAVGLGLLAISMARRRRR